MDRFQPKTYSSVSGQRRSFHRLGICRSHHCSRTRSD